MFVYLFLGALIISIVLGFALKLNAGVVALVFAFINGIFFYGFSVKQVIGMWPVSLFLMLFLVMFFYGFAIANGTIENLAAHIAYAARKAPPLLPIVLWLLCLAIAASGAGPYAVFAFMSVIVMRIAVKSGMPMVLAAVTVISGGSIGGQCPISVGGIVIRNYAATVGYEQMAFSVASHVFLNTFICQGLIFVAAYLLCGGYRLKIVAMEKPEPMSKENKINLGIIIFVLLLTVLPATLSLLFPQAAFLATLKDACDITFTSAIGITLCMLLRVSNEKSALSMVPWPTIMLICGIGVLIGTATSVGVISSLSAWIQENVSGAAAAYLLILTSSCMSFFSSTLGVVVPTLSTLVPVLETTTGMSPGLLFSILTVPALLTGYSPFSSSGAMTLNGASEADKPRLFNYMLAAPFVFFVYITLLVFIGVVR